MDTAKTATGVGLGIVIGGVALFALPFLGCCGLTVLGSALEEAEQTATVNGEQVPRYEVSDITVSRVETNSSFSKYSFAFKVYNNGAPSSESFEVELLNTDGLIIDSEIMWNENLSSGPNTLRGTILISANNRDRDNVHQVSVKKR